MKDFKASKLGAFSPSAKRGLCELRLIEPIVDPGCLEIQAIEFRLEKD
jgi:hypothetical protein